MTGPGLVCPACPLCGSESHPMSEFTAPVQLWCPSDACRVIVWNGTLPDGGLSDMEIVDLERREDDR